MLLRGPIHLQPPGTRDRITTLPIYCRVHHFHIYAYVLRCTSNPLSHNVVEEALGPLVKRLLTAHDTIFVWTLPIPRICW